MRARLALLVLLTMPLAAIAHVAAQSANELPSATLLLSRAAKYLETYEKAFSGVVSEEHYTQTKVPATGAFGSPSSNMRRELTSDIIGIADTSHIWLAFRDVFAVDGSPVRDRDQRLQNLFLSAKDDMIRRARDIADEGARFNIGSVVRNTNFPTMALAFLAAENQARSEFQVRGTDKIGAIRAVKLSFEEKQTPTIVRSGELDLPMHGTFWIDPATGAILKIESHLDATTFSGEMTVEFSMIDKLKLWMPVKMDDVSSTAREAIRGRATYSNFRKFGVSTDVIIKTPLH